MLLFDKVRGREVAVLVGVQVSAHVLAFRNVMAGPSGAGVLGCLGDVQRVHGTDSHVLDKNGTYGIAFIGKGEDLTWKRGWMWLSHSHQGHLEGRVAVWLTRGVRGDGFGQYMSHRPTETIAH